MLQFYASVLGSCFSVLSAFQDYNEVLIPGNYLYFQLLTVRFLVVEMDEVWIPSKHLHFFFWLIYFRY